MYPCQEGELGHTKCFSRAVCLPLDMQLARAYSRAQKLCAEGEAVLTLRVNGKTYQVDAEPDPAVVGPAR